MLKKVLCLLLVLALSAAFFACGDNGAADLGTGGDDDKTTQGEGGNVEPETNEPGKKPIDDKTTVDHLRAQVFFNTVNNSTYNYIKTKSEISNPMFGETEACISSYETIILGENSYRLTYSREQFYNPGEGNGEDIKYREPEHVIVYDNGVYTFDGVRVVENPDPTVLNVKLALDTKYLGNYTLSEDGTKLTTKVTVSDIQSVLGITVNATSQVSLGIEINGASLYMITVDYENGNNHVHIETSYTYN